MREREREKAAVDNARASVCIYFEVYVSCERREREEKTEAVTVVFVEKDDKPLAPVWIVK